VCTVTSTTFTATAVGGTAPYTYLWTGSFYSINSSTSISTTATVQILCGENSSSSLTCTVTDATMATASDSVTVYYSDSYSGICP
jgi:hypothetical protein